MEEVYTQYLPFGKICCTCKEFLLFENFNQSNSTKDGYRKQCQECRRKQDKINREKAKLKPDYVEKCKGSIQCQRCGEWREVKYLRSAKSKGSDCFKCNSEKSKAYLSQPHIKAIYSIRSRAQVLKQGGIPKSDNWKGKTGELNPHWKSGLPICMDCGKGISIRTAKRCKKCAGKSRILEVHQSWIRNLPDCLDCGKKLSAYGTKRCPDCYHAFRTGENHPLWKGGVTSASRKERASKEYREWRNAVLKRDKLACLLCGKLGGKRGKGLHVHHKKEWVNYKELRFEVDNGATLCGDCHEFKAHNGNWYVPPINWDELVKEYG